MDWGKGISVNSFRHTVTTMLALKSAEPDIGGSGSRLCTTIGPSTGSFGGVMNRAVDRAMTDG